MLELKVILLVWLAFIIGYFFGVFMVGANQEMPRPETARRVRRD